MKAEKLMEAFQIDLETARSVRRCLTDLEYAEQQPGGAARIAECYNPPDDYDVQLHAVNKLINGFGVEYIADKDDSYSDACGIDYVNMGDTYALTVCYDHTKNKFFLSSWGDIVERHPNRFE